VGRVFIASSPFDEEKKPWETDREEGLFIVPKERKKARGKVTARR
jgi:hypothetical protein